MKNPSCARAPGAVPVLCFFLTVAVVPVPAQSPAAGPERPATGTESVSRVNETSHAPASDPVRTDEDTRGRFIRKAQVAGQRAMQLSELAVTHASDATVRAYAEQIVAEHRELAQELAPLRAMPDSSRPTGGDAPMPPAAPPDAGPADPAGAGTPAGPVDDESGALSTTTDSSGASSQGLGERWNRMLDERKRKALLEKTGPAFDRAYTDLMVQEHREAIELFEEAAASSDPAVQAVAKKYLPALRQELAQAQALAKDLP